MKAMNLANALNDIDYDMIEEAEMKFCTKKGFLGNMLGKQQL